MIFCHFDDHSAVRGAFPFDLIDKIMHKQNAASRRFQKIFGICRVGNFLDIEAFAEIADEDFQRLGGTDQRYLDIFARVELVAVFDGVGERFANRHIDAEQRVVGKACFARKDGRFLHRFVNRFDFAGDGKFCFFCAHRLPIKIVC